MPPRKKANLGTKDDFDLEDLRGGDTAMPQDKAKKLGTIKSFCAFCKVEYDGNGLPDAGIFTDVNIAKFLLSILQNKGPAAHFRKGAVSALNDMLLKLELTICMMILLPGRRLK
jgi:hypothetical protein